MLVRMMLKHRRSLLLTVSVMGISFAAAAPCQAGPLWDWLFGPRQVAYYPVTTVASPVTVAAPATGCNTCATPVQQTTVNYVPQTAYRSSWARVPVTYYRPVATVNPTTGCPTNATQACTTYQWQVRRVPVTVMRPVYNATSCCPTTAAYQTTAVAAPQTISPGCSSCSSGYAATGSPQYLSTPVAAPAATPSATVVPSMPQQPADLRPSLSPGSLPSTTSQYGGTVNANYGAATVSGSSYNAPVTLPPVVQPSVPQPPVNAPTLAPATGSSAQQSVLSPTGQLPNNSTRGASYSNNTASNLTPTIRTPRAPTLPSLPPTPPTTVAPTTTTAPSNHSKLLPPIPSQDTQVNDPQFNLDRVPQLLRPQSGDKTAAASVLQASSFNTVAWPQQKSTPIQPMKHRELVTPSANPPAPTKQYDDSGWSTAR